MILGLKAGQPEISRVFTIILGRRLEESACALWRYYSSIRLERMRKTIKLSARIASIPAEIRTEHFPNTCLERYRCTNPIGCEDTHGCPQSLHEDYYTP
jgi:hypothetical protein